ncbi:hypothetical protein, partial [Actinotignum sp. GS-2025b]
MLLSNSSTRPAFNAGYTVDLLVYNDDAARAIPASNPLRIRCHFRGEKIHTSTHSEHRRSRKHPVTIVKLDNQKRFLVSNEDEGGCGLFIGHYRLKPLDDAPQSLNHR